MATAENNQEVAKQDRHTSPIARVNAALSARLEAIEQVLPEYCRGSGERLIKRAMLEYARTEALQKCTLQSFVMAVIEAAEVGLAIDGKLAHAVPYGDKCTCIVDYRGLIEVARRSGSIADIRPGIVCEHDTFAHGISGPVSHLEHTYRHDEDRGDLVAVYAIIEFPDGRWSYELMQRAEVEAIRSRARAKSGPWQTDFAEMAKKTVIRRALKRYAADERLGAAIEMADREFPALTPPSSAAIQRSTLNDELVE